MSSEINAANAAHKAIGALLEIFEPLKTTIKTEQEWIEWIKSDDFKTKLDQELHKQ